MRKQTHLTTQSNSPHVTRGSNYIEPFKIFAFSTVNNFAFRNTAERNTDNSSTVRISIPFNDQVAANAVRRQLRDLGHKIGPTLQPVFVSKKLGQDLKPKEIKPLIVNQQCVVYHFSCDLCDADYVGYTVRHLHQCIAEHKNSAICKHLLEAHGSKNLLKANLQF